MDPTASIRKLGFRRWYERQLIDCHAALVTCLLCGVTIAALIEELSGWGAGWQPLVGLFGMIAAAALGLYSWRRYITVLERAERYGERSTCANCNTYGRFDIVATGLDPDAKAARSVAPLEAAWMRVCCRKCGAIWRMPD